MICEKMEKALNNQFNVELSSAYLYLDMHTFLEKKGLFGFANWMCIQVKEELEHAKGIYDYILERGGNVCLHPIEKPAGEWDCVVKVFEAVLAHEKRVTGEIFNLMDIAEEVNDKSTEAFLDWYIKEQVEEENTVEKILRVLYLINFDMTALLAFDRDLMKRTFQIHEIK